MSTATIDKVIEYAAKGYKQVEIARALGVDESRVSQIVEDEEFAKRIEETAVAFTEENERFDAEVDKAEGIALGNVTRKLGIANMQQSLAALKILNAMKRRRDTAPATRQATQQVVQLNLPQIAVNNYVVNASSEIVEVSGRTMISAAPGQLVDFAEKTLGRKVEDVKQVRMSESKSARVLDLLEAVPTRRRSTAGYSLEDIS